MLALLALLLAAPPLTAAASVEGSLEATLVRSTGDHGKALAAQVARLLAWRGDVVRNVHRGDELRLAWRPAAVPELLALHYRGAEITVTAYLYTGDEGIGRFYDDGGTLVEPVLAHSPVPAYVQITEVVQNGSGKRRHSGLDLKAALGAAVLLPFAGRVTRTNWSMRQNGNCVEVRYHRGEIARFLHLDEIDAGVAPGVQLAQGVRIGAVGSTGRSIAPHLHYELRSVAGDVLDPLAVHGRGEGKLSAAHQSAFAALSATYASLLRSRPP